MFWFFGPAEECSKVLGTRFLIWQAAFLANHASSSFPTFFALPRFVTPEVKTYVLFKGQLLSSVAMTIDEACRQGLFEECELFFSRPEVSESMCPPLPFQRGWTFPIAHVLAAAGRRRSERARRASPRPSAPFGQRSSVCVSGAGGVPPNETASFPWQEKETPWLMRPDGPTQPKQVDFEL